MVPMVLILYFLALLTLLLFGVQGFVMVYYHFKSRTKEEPPDLTLEEFPPVTIQLPIYNEVYVVERLIKAACRIKYPTEKLEIQVLDDSTDETTSVVTRTVTEMVARGYHIEHIQRGTREGYKAGALREGLKTARGEFIAIFDADFVPREDFLMRTMPYFFRDEKIGMVQTRWEHLNTDYSLLTRAQAMALDGHFVIEQVVRNRSGFFINFNGTGGIWRKACIVDAGNWHDDTLTEDLDLSYRAQLRGWRFKFLRDVTSPAELPSEINALKSQQFRWTKGAIETAKKILPLVWRSKLPLRIKLQSTFHLTNNLVFPFILLAGVLNVPLVYVKNHGGYETYFALMSIFVVAFIGSLLFYTFSQKEIYPDWRRRLFLFPLFMAGSMGFAVNNTKAVIEGLISKKREFVRTPKYAIEKKGDAWTNKKYVPKQLSFTSVVELVLALYCLFGVLSSLYFAEIAAVPFQLLFCLGFGFVSFLSFKHAWTARQPRLAR
jgi:cellulose synthase/poly-beta-1,6-N-acetylglucosamine synthase-like glycosyltransferase